MSAARKQTSSAAIACGGETPAASVYLKMRFSQTALEKIKPLPGQVLIVHDSRGTGMLMVARGRNRKHPDCDHKIPKAVVRFAGKELTLTFSPLFPILDLKEWERQTVERHYMARQGIDPRGDRTKPKPEPVTARKVDTLGGTIDRFVDQFLYERKVDGSLKRRSSSHRIETERYLRHAMAYFGHDCDLAVIKRPRIREYLAQLPAEHRSANNKTLVALKTFFNWCASADVELLDQSPATGIKPPGGEEEERTRSLSDPEIVLVWRATEQLDPPYRQLVRLLLVLAQRLGETSMLQWVHIVDTAAGKVWVIPLTKNGKPQSVPLLPLAWEILSELPRISAYAFPGRNNRPGTAFSLAKKKLDRRLAEICLAEGREIPPPWRYHDLRRTAATGMSKLAVSAADISKVLNHTSTTDSSRTTKTYVVHSHDGIKAAVLQKWESKLRSLLGDLVPPLDNLVSFPDRLSA